MENDNVQVHISPSETFEEEIDGWFENKCETCWCIIISIVNISLVPFIIACLYSVNYGTDFLYVYLEYLIIEVCIIGVCFVFMCFIGNSNGSDDIYYFDDVYYEIDNDNEIINV